MTTGGLGWFLAGTLPWLGTHLPRLAPPTSQHGTCEVRLQCMMVPRAFWAGKETQICASC